jgi:phage terminase large subunit
MSLKLEILRRKGAARRIARDERADAEQLVGEYIPYGACKELFENDDDRIVISGPAGTGKSRACLEKVHRLMLKHPGARGLIARKTRTSLSEAALFTFEEIVLGEGHPILRPPRKRKYRDKYVYPNGSEIILAGMDLPSKILSTEFDIIYVQETIELDADDWDILDTRLRNWVLPFQQQIGDTNPGPPQHWVKGMCDRGDAVMLESRHEDNPVLWDRVKKKWTKRGKAYLKRLDRLTGALKQRLRFGLWVQSEGVVYEDYDPVIHLIPRRELPLEWRRIRVIDFGVKNPFVCHWWIIDNDGRMYLDREIYMTGRTVNVHAELINQISEGMDIEQTVCDHDLDDRMTLEEHGIENIHAYKAISLGIQNVKERLQRGGDGKPRMFIFDDALIEMDESLEEAGLPWCTAQEFNVYIYPKGQSGKPKKEVPVDANNHGMDGARYGAAYVDGIGTPSNELTSGESPLDKFRGGTISREDVKAKKGRKRRMKRMSERFKDG